jgi:hypothetical protein
MIQKAFPFLLALLGLGTVACIKVPTVLVVDHKTALEEQAAGTYRPLKEELMTSAPAAGPVPLTEPQLAKAGTPTRLTTESEDRLATESDALLADEWLSRRCLGEAADGSLVVRRETCTISLDVGRATKLVERTNRSRFQLWRSISTRSNNAPIESVRDTWRKVHLEGVVCGAPIQSAAGTWENKSC